MNHDDYDDEVEEEEELEQPDRPMPGDDDFEEISQDDCWKIITKFFDEKGLVRQQLDSFDEFVQNTMQELVEESGELVLDQYDQHTGGDNDVTRRYEIKFGQIYLSRPTITEADGTVVPIFPQEARLRNLTYSAPLYIEMTKKVLVGREDPSGLTGETQWRLESGDDENAEPIKVWIGKVCCPEMLSFSAWTQIISRFPSCCGLRIAFSII